MIHLHKDKSKGTICPKQGALYLMLARQIEMLSTKVCHNHNQGNVFPHTFGIASLDIYMFEHCKNVKNKNL